MLLATLYHDEKREKGHATLWRYDLSDLAWRTLHEEVFDLPGRSGDDVEIERASIPGAVIRLTPDPRQGGECAEVWWGLRKNGRWVRVNENFSTSRIEEPALAADGHFVSWKQSEGSVIALVEHEDGRRRLIRSDLGSDAGWQPMDGPENSESVSALAVFQGALHVTVDDDRRGFSLWKLETKMSSPEPVSWQPVLRLGAFRYLLNAGILALASREDALYLAAGRKKALPVNGTVGALTQQDFELLRVYPENGGWDVIVGQPRFTADGLKVPISGRGPGFNEREPMQECRLIDAAWGLLLGMVGTQGLQLWQLDATDQWQEVYHGALLEYQRVRLPAAYPTSQGIFLVTECLDFGGKDSLEFWMVPRSKRLG